MLLSKHCLASGQGEVQLYVSPATPFQSLLNVGSDFFVATETTADFLSWDGSGLGELAQSANWREQECESLDTTCPILLKLLLFACFRSDIVLKETLEFFNTATTASVLVSVTLPTYSVVQFGIHSLNFLYFIDLI